MFGNNSYLPALWPRTFSPTSDAAYALGTTSKRWTDIYQSGTIYGTQQLVGAGVGSILSIITDTIDGTDNKAVAIGGGGGTAPGRGAYLLLAGNEYASGNGHYLVHTGTASNAVASITLNATSGGKFHIYNATPTSVFNVDQTGVLTLSGNIVGPTTGSWRLAPNTSDGTDSVYSILCGGGGYGSTRGASIVLYGNESPSVGQLDFLAGATAPMTWSTNNTTRLTLLGTSASILFRGTPFIIASETSDGSDTMALYLCGGSSNATSRGGYLSLFGNEHATQGGNTFLYCGNNGGSYIEFGGANGGYWQMVGTSGVLKAVSSTATLQWNASKQATGVTTCTLGTNSPSSATTPSTWLKLYNAAGQEGVVPFFLI